MVSIESHRSAMAAISLYAGFELLEALPHTTR